MTNEISGSCLCNQVKFTVNGPFKLFALCHCSRCRKSTGSAHTSNIFTQADRINWISGDTLVKRYELPDAKRFTKAFCSQCGCPVPCISRDGKRLLIPAGCLDDDPAIRPHVRIYCADKAPWYEQIDLIASFDGAAT
jgi:hypothetical protein